MKFSAVLLITGGLLRRRPEGGKRHVVPCRSRSSGRFPGGRSEAVRKLTASGCLVFFPRIFPPSRPRRKHESIPPMCGIEFSARPVKPATIRPHVCHLATG